VVLVVVVDEVVVVLEEVVVDEDVEVAVWDALRKPLLVGDRKLKTKAAIIPSDATTASTLRRTDQRVSDDRSGGRGGGSSAVGGGPYRGIRWRAGARRGS
jgi:hypothetical protein